MNDPDFSFFHTHNLKYKKVLGRGSYGVIYLVYSKHYKQLFAVKRIMDQDFKQSEIDIIKMLYNTNIVNLYGYYFYRKNVYMIMEYCPMNLYNSIKNNPKHVIPKEILMKYSFDILEGIKACHDNNIAHQDIKPTNFLIDEYGRVKVCDFGFSQQVDYSQFTSECPGSYMFMAPEILKKEPHNPFKSDIWALGITFYFMATKMYPWSFDNKAQLIKKIETMKVPKNMDKIDPQFASIIYSCLNLDPRKRPSVNQLLSFPFFEPIYQSKAKAHQKTTKNIGSFSSRPIVKIVKPFFSTQRRIQQISV